ncbi:hypothetical protein C9J21_17785 [Photobacterium phosphoreum]|uniref:hypothetical protein n=1 Tax=Photobacterium phosphoreum TaxID=659 RepID=UPI000D168EE5|nr:hypothetical protein [Photobacterium phosphoreum]PSW31200.1 hypothetical protein C9J21_17785 [Photobacterium phosphoreum]
MKISNVKSLIAVTRNQTGTYKVWPFILLDEEFCFSTNFTCNFFGNFCLNKDIDPLKIEVIVDELSDVIKFLPNKAELINDMGYTCFINRDHSVIYTDMTNDMFLNNLDEAKETIASLIELPKLCNNSSTNDKFCSSVSKIQHDLSYNYDNIVPEVVAFEICRSLVKNSDVSIFINGENVYSSIDKLSTDYVTTTVPSDTSIPNLQDQLNERVYSFCLMPRLAGLYW